MDARGEVMQRRTLSHYEVIDKVGSGGMAGVYRARDTQLSREVIAVTFPDARALELACLTDALVIRHGDPTRSHKALVPEARTA